MTLDKISIGQSCVIKNFLPATECQFRLMELGFKAGEAVDILQRAPFRGPLKVKIKGSRFAICHEDACCIAVEPVSRSLPHSHLLHATA